jgi:hypothetical protein
MEIDVRKAEIVKEWKPEMKALGFVYRDLLFQLKEGMEQSLQFAIVIQRNLHSDTYLIHFKILLNNPFSTALRPEVLVNGICARKESTSTFINPVGGLASSCPKDLPV